MVPVTLPEKALYCDFYDRILFYYLYTDEWKQRINAFNFGSS